ncbi:MAG: hypothetical protein ACRCS9_16790, partial [Hyphomicrobium sp.]
MRNAVSRTRTVGQVACALALAALTSSVAVVAQDAEAPAAAPAAKPAAAPAAKPAAAPAAKPAAAPAAKPAAAPAAKPAAAAPAAKPATAGAAPAAGGQVVAAGENKSAWVKLCEKAPLVKKDKDGKDVKEEKELCLTH